MKRKLYKANNKTSFKPKKPVNPKSIKVQIETIEIKQPNIKTDPHKIRESTRSMIQEANTLLEKLDSKIAIIQAPTGSGKTHSIVEEVKLRFGNQMLNRKVAIALPTRANVFNLGGLTDELAANFGMHVGGDNGDMTELSNYGTIYTYGKLFETLKIDPLLSQYEELILDEADIIANGQEVRWIPVLKWLKTVRPELKIILMSATLDIEGFKTLFDIDAEAVFTDLSNSRPRPIQQLYVSELEVKSRDLYIPKTSLNYINFAIDAVTTMIMGKNALIPNEAVLVFMPTISSVERLAAILDNKYSHELEIRTLHSKKTKEELDKDITIPIEQGRVGVLIATDIIGRGINFADDLRINRVIHSGLSNRRNYNAITRRDLLGVGIASAFDVTQAFGRAGRSIKDDRPVVGMCLQPISRLKKGLENSLNNNDPTYTILQCSRVLKRIQKLTNISYVPSSLLEFISPVVVDKDKIAQSINKLQSLDALDANETITDFGTFLIDIGLDLDFGLMLYSSLNTSYWARLCDVLCLASRGGSLVNYELKDIYNSFVMRLTKVSGVKSDLEVFDHIVKTITNTEEALTCGINFEAMQESLVASKVLKRKINEYISNSSLDVTKMEDTIDFEFLAREALSDCLFEYSSKTRDRNRITHEYTHLASKNIFNLSPFSVLNINKLPRYLIASNMAIMSGALTITDAVPVEIESLTPNGFNILDKVESIERFDKNSGVGKAKVSRIYRGYKEDVVLDSFSKTFDNDDFAVQAMANYLAFDSKDDFVLNNKQLINRIKFYSPKLISKNFSYDFYYQSLRQNDITNKLQLKPIIMDLKTVLSDQDYKQVRNLCPNVIENLSIQYLELKKGEIVPVVELKYSHLADGELITKLLKPFGKKLLTPTKQGNKIIYRPVREASKSIIQTYKSQLLKSALELNDQVSHGNIKDLITVPGLPDPIEYISGQYIYPFFLVDYTHNLILNWSDHKISSKEALNKVSKAIEKKSYLKSSLDYIDSPLLDQELKDLLLICHNNELDKEYQEIKFLIEGLKTHKHDLNIDERLKDVLSRVESEKQYLIRGAHGAETIEFHVKKFIKKYDKKAYQSPHQLTLDNKIIAKVNKVHNYDKKKDYNEVEVLTTKVINPYNSIRFKNIEEL